MKNLFIFLLFTYSVVAQTITIKSIEQVTQLEQGEFFRPVAGPRGQLLFAGPGFKGLYHLDVQSEISVLSAEAGAGYEPTFSADGNYVYFRSYKYDGMRKLSSLIKMSVSNKDTQLLISNERNFTSPRKLSNGAIAVSKNSDMHISDVSQLITSNKAPSKAVFIEKGTIALYVNGEKTTIKPMGDGFYLWPSLSPDGSKLLFTKAGKGTFISTLNGNILVELGYANAPQWSPDGKWIVFMRDLDDGHKLLESDIFLISSDGKTTIPVTQTNEIKEIYPFWGVENEIVFGSDQGVIYKAILNEN